MLSFNTEEREALLDQRWLEVLIAVLGGRMGHVVTGKKADVFFRLTRKILSIPIRLELINWLLI